MFRSACKALLLRPIYSRAQRLYRSTSPARALQLHRASRKLAAAPRHPEWLEPETLARINALYPVRRDYGYDPQTVRERGATRYTELISKLGVEPHGDFLEIGAYDAMVAAAICQGHGRATAVDLDDNRDDRAVAAGVAFVSADAGALPFSDGSFDVVYSYNTFEHLAEPDKALGEALRVLRPGGSIYLSFGPLYCAAFGLHAYYNLGVPYCQFLWERSVIDEFVAARAGAPLDYVNGWSLESYRELWRTADAETREYRELRDLRGLHLIEKFPSCFKKAPSLDSLLVSQLDIVLTKRP